MSSSSKPGATRNVPPPPGSKAGNAYTRFIPREEMGSFEAWKPGSLRGNTAPAEAPAPPPPAPPSEAEWLARVAAARQAGSQEGYQNGYRDGLVALDSFKQSFAAQTATQVGAFVKSLDTTMTALEPQIAAAVSRVALELARQVLRTELATRPEVVASVASQAVQAVLFSARQITLQVHPEDLPLVQTGAADALEARGARVMANPSLARGSVVVDSDVGSIDARVATRWAQATASLGSAQAWEHDDQADDPPTGDVR